RLRFNCEGGRNGNQTSPADQPPKRAGEGSDNPSSDPNHTPLRADEMSTLYAFMAASVGETDPGALIRRALATVPGHTGATRTGALSLDEDTPLPKIVLPEMAQVDVYLSRQLTQSVQQHGRLVWLGARTDSIHQSDSLLPFNDAVCLPLRADGEPLGAL